MLVPVIQGRIAVRVPRVGRTNALAVGTGVVHHQFELRRSLQVLLKVPHRCVCMFGGLLSVILRSERILSFQYVRVLFRPTFLLLLLVTASFLGGDYG